MTNHVPLNNVEHADLRLQLRHGAAHGDSVNQMLIFPGEFEEAQRDFPIFFRRDANGAFQSVALLGLDRDENLFLGDGGWESRHIPAVRQRGPFAIGRSEADGEPVVHIDLDDSRVSRAEGLPLFLPHGGNAPVLVRILGALQAILTGVEASKAMFAAFEACNLIEPAVIEISLDDDRRYQISDFHSISEQRFSELDGAALEGLHKAGFLRAACLVLASVPNVNRLITLKNRKRVAGP